MYVAMAPVSKLLEVAQEETCYITMGNEGIILDRMAMGA